MTDTMVNLYLPSTSSAGGELWLDKPKRPARGKALFICFLLFTIVSVITAFFWIASAFAASPTGGCGGG